MPTVADRSQPILRVPRDQTPVSVTLHDGERASALLFVPPGDSIAKLLSDSTTFVPVSYSSGTRLVARTAIACITVHVIHARLDDGDLPRERQRAIVRLRAGTLIQGELRWIAPPGRRRTLDCINDDATHLMIHDGDYVSYIAKAHIA